MSSKSKRQKVLIEVPSEPGTQPFVCYFPTGRPADADGLNLSLYASNSGRSSQHVLVGSRERMDYVGTTVGQEYTAPQPCQYAVGVFDRASGKLQLMPLQGGKVLRMEARLHGLDYGPSGLAVQEATTREEKLAMNKRLVDSFGSTRRRRQLASREEGIVRTEKIGSVGALTQVLQKQAQQAQESGHTRDQVLNRVTQTIRNLPPHHPEARVPTEAYCLEELIPAAAREYLDNGRLLNASEDSEALEKLRSYGMVPAYVLGRLHLLLDPDRTKAKERARNLAFLGALLTLVNGSPELRVDPERGGLLSLSKRLHMKPELLQELLELFYTRSSSEGGDGGSQEKYERSAMKKELMLAYVLVLAQLLEGGGLAAAQFEALKEELKMKPTDLVMRFREVGSTCIPTSLKVDSGASGDLTSVRSFNIVLLKDPNKTLAECFPGIKVGPKRK